MQRPISFASGALLVLAGGIWVLQGFNVWFAPQSFMTNDAWWIFWGAIAILVGIVVMARSQRD